MEFPSTKRMKKRKELDALVSSKKSSKVSLPDRLPSTRTRSDRRLLLRSQDSESDEAVSFRPSPVETEVDSWARKDRGCCGESVPSVQRHHRVCGRVCLVAAVTLCAISVAGLGWMQLGLRREMRAMGAQSRTLHSERISSRLSRLETEDRELETRVGEIAKDRLPSVTAELKSMLRRLDKLNSTVEDLGESIRRVTNSSSVVGETRRRTFAETLDSLKDFKPWLVKTLSATENTRSNVGAGSSANESGAKNVE